MPGSDPPRGPGVYAFHGFDGAVLYVGKARSLRRRLRTYFRPDSGEPTKHRALAGKAWSLSWRETGSELEALLLEQSRIARLEPPLNRQTRVHRRRRGPLRNARSLCVFPSIRAGRVEVCLVSGAGNFHWESVARRALVPRGLWRRIVAFLEGEPGWGPEAPGEILAAEAARELAELTLGWLARRGDMVSRIDLADVLSRAELRRRTRRLLAEDARGGRVEVR